jgi:hypothetical protein
MRDVLAILAQEAAARLRVTLRRAVDWWLASWPHSHGCFICYLNLQRKESQCPTFVTIETKVHDHAAVAAACRRLQLKQPVQGTVELFSGNATGLIVQLPEWQYPVVINTLTGQIRFDDFNGHWGNRAE